MRAKKFYKAARDYVQDLLENDILEGLKVFATKAIDKLVMDGIKDTIRNWKDYLIPKVEAILRLIVSRDPVSWSELCIWEALGDYLLSLLHTE